MTQQIMETLFASLLVGLATIWLVEGLLRCLAYLVSTGRFSRGHMELIVRQFTAVSGVIMIVSAAYLSARGSVEDVHHDQITFGLPVFVGSMMAVGGFVWAVARWDAKREKTIDRLAQKIDTLYEQLKMEDDDVP